jgi:hypothetical protein
MTDYLVSAVHAMGYDEASARATTYGGSSTRGTFFGNHPPDIRIKIGKSPHPMGGGWANAPIMTSRASMRTRNTVREQL